MPRTAFSPPCLLALGPARAQQVQALEHDPHNADTWALAFFTQAEHPTYSSPSLLETFTISEGGATITEKAVIQHADHRTSAYFWIYVEGKIDALAFHLDVEILVKSFRISADGTTTPSSRPSSPRPEARCSTRRRSPGWSSIRSDPTTPTTTRTPCSRPGADLGVAKTDEVETAVPGEDTLVYTIVATNAGPSAVSSVELDDVLPDGLSCTFESTAADGATATRRAAPATFTSPTCSCPWARASSTP